MSHETMKLNRNEQFDETESEIVVHFKYHAGREATRIDPAEEPEIEILKIEASGSDITDLLTDEEFEYIENFIFEDWQDTSADDLADYKYQQFKDKDI